MKFIQAIFRGVGQVMFQNNQYSGLLFLLGIFYNSWILGLAALFGTIISTATAYLLKYDEEAIENGLYGFNGTLTGIALWFFFDVNLTTVIALIIGSVLSTIVMHSIKKIGTPFTAPFVVVTWFMIYTLLFLFKLPLASISSTPDNTIDLLAALSHSFGQVMFQENIITGLLFLAGVFINNRLMAAYAVYAAILGSLTGWLVSETDLTINAGLMGYNAILCAIALSGKKWVDLLWITLAICSSTLLNIALAKTGIITLTAAFVITTWMVLFLKNRRKLTLAS